MSLGASSEVLLLEAVEATGSHTTLNCCKAGIRLPGFGSFEAQERGERQGRNLHTGEPITIAASKVIRFSAGSKLKAAVNNKTE